MLKNIFLVGFSLLLATASYAHFGMIIPSQDIVEQEGSNVITLRVMFAHPFAGNTLEMEKPVKFGVVVRGKKYSLLESLKPVQVKGYTDRESHKGWITRFRLKRPGDYVFYCVPQPYWEPAEDKFIVHYTKVIVDAFGREEGWDKELGLKTEIIPLTRPYGLYAGNTFQGLVKVNGKIAPFTEVEVEYFNEDGKVKAPREPFVTQVIKSDANGVFTYTIPWAGWWGFAALNEDEKKISYKGEEKPVEIGAVIWVKAYEGGRR
ncbi:MAG: DUF4198 domain-containing protein [Caldiserica bacterium]|nr:DUF4198 domain-containing protein [Caldisericota bacterium]